ncbi:DNA repair protein REV1, partial [Gryllus bimaculatus]
MIVPKIVLKTDTKMIKKKSKRERRGEDEDNGFAIWGGYMAAKISKLEDQFTVQAGKETEHESNIFQGIAIYVNGYTVPGADELKRIMILHGGVFHHYETRKTTHIIASNLPDTKVKQLKTLNVVKPAWIVDSVTAGTLLDFRKYLLYSNHTKSQPRLNFQQEISSKKTIKKDNELLPCDQDSESNSVDNETKCKEVDTSTCLRSENEQQHTDHCGNGGVENGLRELVKSCPDSPSLVKSKQSPGSSPSKARTASASRRTAVEPQFLSEFYGNSRLHHLSTMGAMFKEYVAKLREDSQGDFPGIKRLMEWKKNSGIRQDLGADDDIIDDFDDETFMNERNKKVPCPTKTIMHIDMDCFFVSVGLRNRPDLHGCPVAVTHAKGNASRVREGTNRQYEREFYRQRFQNRLKQRQSGRSGENEKVERKSRLDDVDENESLSEIASCNYEARKAGVKNGMFFGTAIKLCPDLKTIPYDFEGYKEVSYKLYDILASYTLEIEAVSCDEMYVNCSEILKKANVTSLEFASFLRAELKEATGCTASAGFGSNPLQARLATKKAKPNGQFHLLPTDVEMFMHNIKVEDLPGVGHSLAYRLHAEGITDCRDLQRLSLASLQRKFGNKTGETLHQHARGDDQRALDVCHQRKSVSAEVNYGIRFTTQKEAEAFVQQLAQEVVSRMKQARVRSRQVTLKLMIRAKDAPVETAKFMGHGACDNISRSVSLGTPTDDPDIIYREAVALERQLKISPSDLRGVGIQMNRLVHSATSGSAKSTVLTKFLGLKKTKEENSEARIESDGGKRIGTESNNVKSPSKRIESTKISQCAEVSNIPVGRVTGLIGEVKMEKKRSAVNDKMSEERKLVEHETDSKNKSFSKVGRTAASCDHVGSPVGGKPKITSEDSNPIPILTPPVEVPMMTLSQARKLVRAWVTSEVNPQTCDVVMFTNYIQRLVLARHLEDVDILFSLLHRLLINKGRPWKAAYGTIVKNTQTIMQTVYGANLKFLKQCFLITLKLCIHIILECFFVFHILHEKLSIKIIRHCNLICPLAIKVDFKQARKKEKPDQIFRQKYRIITE